MQQPPGDIALTSSANAALQLVNTTLGHIFLTGKAGTGKTTFLKQLSLKTHKSFVIVAPTGIAALNAGGVTIHSQFLLPLGTFLPDRSLPVDFESGRNVYTQNTLARKHPLNSARKQILRSIDLLVIDEVSMLRADVLDAIDYRLKAARGNFRKSFGGVQLLLIGDLYQLPPIIKADEEHLLQRYYPSIWFYESLALKNDGFAYVELDKIFRQTEGSFIRILNNLRNNNITDADIEELNRHYRTQPEIESQKEVITLTTHNYRADEMNRQALKTLDAPSFFFEAAIEGDFPESMYPVPARLELKVGAQVMFIRNDNEGQMYFNGKLATVSRISGEVVTVTMAGSHLEFDLKKERWENKKYTINEETRDLEDEVTGSFEQFPIKLAWAITVHKSQGLTFDKAIIDVGQAFADGQVYVALSRLRTLDGLMLRTKIDPQVVRAARNVDQFTESHNRPEELPGLIKRGQFEFIRTEVDRTFDFELLVKELRSVAKERTDNVGFDDDTMRPVPLEIAQSLESEKENTTRFRKQLINLIEGEDIDKLLERISKGSEYYRKHLWQNLSMLLRHLHEMRQHKRVKTYLSHLAELDQLLTRKLEELGKLPLLAEGIFQGKQEFEFAAIADESKKERARLLAELAKEFPSTKKSGKEKRKGTKGKSKGPSTYDITLQLLESGMDVEAIAKERGLVPGTIEGHLAKAVAAGRIGIHQIVMQEDVDAIANAVSDMNEGFTSKDLYEKLEGKYSYGKLRAVMNHLTLLRVSDKEEF